MDRFLVLHVPSALLGMLLVVASIGVAVGGLLLIRRKADLRTLESHNDATGFFIAIVSALYGVLLAFVVIVVWERFDEAGSVADREADLVLILYGDAAALEPRTAELRSAIRSYARSVVEDEWPAMASSQEDDERTDRAALSLVAAYRSVQPGAAHQEVFLEESIERTGAIAEERRARILASASQLPGPMWVLVLVGAAIMVSFTCFFAVPSSRAHALMVAALACMVALTLFLLISLSFPFTGDVAVGPDAMEDAIREFAHLDAAR